MLPFVIVVRVGLVALENGKEKKSARRGGFGHSFLLMPSQDRILHRGASDFLKKIANGFCRFTYSLLFFLAGTVAAGRFLATLLF